MKTFEERRRATESIQGWLSPLAGERLYRLALSSPTPDAIELGSWRGLSTAWIAMGVADRRVAGRVYAVDTWLGTPEEELHARIIEHLGGTDALYREFLANMRSVGVQDVVVPVRATTNAALEEREVPDECGLLFIDAAHDEEQVLRDYRSWSPRVVTGGFIVFDDVPSWPGPTRIAHEVAGKDLDFVAESENHWIGRKR